MTVKELIDVLLTCNMDAEVRVQESAVPPTTIEDSMIFAHPDGKLVWIDLDWVEENN